MNGSQSKVVFITAKILKKNIEKINKADKIKVLGVLYLKPSILFPAENISVDVHGSPL